MRSTSLPHADVDAPLTTVALVGCAHIHVPRFMDMLQRRDDVRVAAVWDHDHGRAERTAARFGLSPVPELERIWADETVPAVIICSETVRHRDLALAAVEAGKHLFVEKPLAAKASESLEMAQAIDAAGLLFSTGFLLRSRAAHRYVRDEIAAGRMGAITRIEVSVAHAGALEGWFDDEWRWMADPSLAGFGALGDCGTHGVDLILWLLGDGAEPTRVTASTGTLTGRYGSIDEYGHAELEFAAGTHASVWASWVDRANPVQLIVSGSDAHATVIDGRLTYRRIGPDGREAGSQALPEDHPHAFELFLDALAGGGSRELVTAAEAARCDAIVEAIYQAPG